MSEARLLIGDVHDRIADIETDSIDLVLTSPPFFRLRSYLPSDHPSKAAEIGQENSPGEYLASLLRLVDECRRPLAPHGSIAFEIGDSFSGSGGAGGDYADGGLRDGQPAFDGTGRTANGSKHGVDPLRPGNTSLGTPSGGNAPLPKSLCLIPTLFAASLAYGWNLLTGEPLASGQWMVRNLVVWARNNPPVGDLHDKARPATSYLTIATQDRNRYFDLDAVRVPPKSKDDGGSMQNRKAREATDPGVLAAGGSEMFNPNGTPPLDWWEPWPVEQGLWDWWADEIWKINSTGYPGAHYAVMPPALCVRPIKTMTPERVCRTCGEPSRRLVESTRYARDGSVLDEDFTQGNRERGLRQTNETDGGPQFSHVERKQLGWTDCGHDNWRPGCVFDPFGGSGTTAAVATGHGRDCVLIDLDERNADLCRARIGMFLTDIVEPLKDVPPRPVEDIEVMTEAML